jgi:hypothetical protein
MTLRITIEIVPFGEEDKKRTLGVANISNVDGDRICNYEYVFTGNFGEASGHIFNHDRNDGAIELIQRVFTSVTNQI